MLNRLYRYQLKKSIKQLKCCGKKLVIFGAGQELIHPENITIGEDVGLNSNVIINATESQIDIGNRVTISSNAMILAASYDPKSFLLNYESVRKHCFSKIIIGNDVWICAGAILLPNVEIADHVIVGAGSVVNKSIKESHVVVAGNPAKIVKKYD